MFEPAEHEPAEHEPAEHEPEHDSGNPEQALALELSRISALPVSERAAEFSLLHGQLGQLLESTPATLVEENRS